MSTLNFTKRNLRSRTYAAGVFVDPLWSNVVLASHGASLIDLTTSKAFTAYGNAGVSTTQSKFGGSAFYYDGTGDYMSVANSSEFDFAAGEFTIEFFIRVSAHASDAAVFSKGASGSFSYFSLGFVGGGNSLSLWMHDVNSGAYSITGSVNVNDSNWHHVALCRSGNSIRMFVDGTQDGSTVTSSATITSTGDLWFGTSNYSVSTRTITGYIDEIRITKGFGRYTSNFTPPSEELYAPAPDLTTDASWSSTVLLITGNGTNNATNVPIVDNSTSNHSITLYGDAHQGSFSPFPPTPGSEYSTSANIGSLRLDGTGDYAKCASSSDFAFATGDFTVELWYYQSGTTSYGTLFATQDVSTGWSGGDMRLTTGNNNNTLQLASALSALIDANTTFSASTWNHIMVTRSGTTLRLFLNGIQVGSVTNSTNFTENVFVIGAMGGSYPLNGFISNLNVIKGTAKYTSNFAIPPSPVTAHANTKLLLDFNTSAIRDETGKHMVKLVGDTKLKSDQFKYGSSSMYFDGTGDWVDFPANVSSLAIGSNAFTIEMWVYVISVSAARGLITLNASTSGYAAVTFSVNTAGRLDLAISTNGSSWASITGTRSDTFPLNQWVHVALCRDSSGVIRSFQDGVAFTHGTISGALHGGTNINRLGQYIESVANVPFYGYISDFRFTNGVCRYTSNFVPPTQSLPRK
jgi:hypothetical protein